MTDPAPRDWPAFIVANTRLLSPPLTPEIRLHLAEESLPIWQKTNAKQLSASNRICRGNAS